MKKLLTHIFLIVLVGAAVSGCVSKKKYAELENLKSQVDGLLEDEKADLKKAEERIADLEGELDDCNSTAARLRKDSTALANANAELKTDLQDLRASCEAQNERYQNLKAQSSQKIQELIDDLEGLQADLAKREKRLQEMEQNLNRRDSAMNALRQQLAEALLGFEADGLTVEAKNGKVYVTLANKLLFASGSTKIDAKGQSALRELATVLKDQPDLQVLVEGHTDDVPVSNLGAIKDNWDLSVMRSTEVVRILTEAGVPAERVTAGGRGEYLPRAEGKTAEARAQNRRTEIILSPKLEMLYELLNK